MDWSAIKYIFQIPLSWYRKIHDRVFNAYGSNFITVQQGCYGGTEIGVDGDAFTDAVKQSLDGVVKTVNGTAPDANGDVDLGDIVHSVNSLSPDTNGNVNVGTVKSVNGNTPDANGNVAITIPAQTVTSVDHKSPDQQGNIQLNAICTINGHNGDSVGNFSGVATSVNNTSPDANGDVDLGDIVHSVNGTAPDANGDVGLGDLVTTVDGHSPDSNGAVSFGLTASKWVKTDASGHLATTDDNVVTIASNQTGQTYSVNLVTGVTWNGTQLVVAKETFTFSNGVLTSHVAAQSTTIDTTPYSPT